MGKIAQALKGFANHLTYAQKTAEKRILNVLEVLIAQLWFLQSYLLVCPMESSDVTENYISLYHVHFLTRSYHLQYLVITAWNSVFLYNLLICTISA